MYKNCLWIGFILIHSATEAAQKEMPTQNHNLAHILELQEHYLLVALDAIKTLSKSNDTLLASQIAINNDMHALKSVVRDLVATVVQQQQQLACLVHQHNQQLAVNVKLKEKIDALSQGQQKQVAAAEHLSLMIASFKKNPFGLEPIPES